MVVVSPLLPFPSVRFIILARSRLRTPGRDIVFPHSMSWLLEHESDSISDESIEVCIEEYAQTYL